MWRALCSIAAVCALSACTPSAAEDPDIPALTSSDDFQQNGRTFERAAVDLIKSGRCKLTDFPEGAGFLRAATGQDRYFLYCGPVRLDTIIYVNVSGTDYSFER